jgi:hypothetical protein
MAKKDLIKRADGSYSPRGLWDNIRANVGSGKKPTKEMLAQERKINQMANGGKMSSFKASNIQTYAQGGATGGPDLPLGVKKAFEKGTILANPLYMNSFSGALVPQYSVGFATAPVSDEKPGWSITGRIGKEYQGAQDKFKEVFGGQGIPSEMGIPLPKNMSYGLNADFRGKVGLDGQRFTPLVALNADVTQSGFGLSATGGGQFNFGKHNYRQGQLKDGYAAGSAGAFGGWAFGSQAAGPFYGAEGHVDWRPKFFGEMPGMVYAKGKAGFVPGGLPPALAAEVGYKMPVQKAAQIDLPNIPMPDMSPLTSFLGRANKGGEENLQMQGGDPSGDFGPRVNASPIDKRWNKGAEDIYVPSTRSGSNAEPIIYDPNDPEGLGENNFKQGGAMNFKSPAAYKAWLAYGHATGEFERTPGNQAVSIGGKAHNVKHAMGGHTYSMGGRAFADGGQLTEFNEGGSHEMNPLGGIPQGFAQDGKLNLVEQGETKLNAADYIFSDQIKVSKEAATLFELPKSAVGKTYADLSKKLNRPDSRRENDTIEQVAIQRDLENLMQAQEQQKDMEKQDAIAEMQAKYPDLQVVDPAAMQQMQAPQDSAMMDEAMMQQQQQMAPPAGVPQEMDPAMMAQMQQQGMMSMGGKMYNMGGHLYGAGGGMMALRGIGSALYGIGEGVLDAATFGTTDNLTDKGYEKLSQIGDVDRIQEGRLDAARGFGNAAGALGSAILTGGATTKSAISEGVEGLASGVAALPGTNEKVDKVAQGVGQAASLYGSMFGGAPENMNVIPKGALEGNKAATQLMNAPQNKFITQAMDVAGNFMAQGGYLGAPTGGMFTNQFAGGSFMDPGDILGGRTLEQALSDPAVLEAFMPANGDVEAAKAAIIAYYSPAAAASMPVEAVTFNVGGKPMSLNLDDALQNMDVLKEFMPEDAEVDESGDYTPEDVELARQNLKDYYTANMPSAESDESGYSEEGTYSPLNRLPGETDEQYMNRIRTYSMGLDNRQTIGQMKANPIASVAKALPAIYNIGRGIFGKADKLNEEDYMNKGTISPYEMNVDPQVAAAQRAYATSIQAAKNAAPGAGSYLATLGNMANMRQQAIRDIYAQKENFDKSQKLEADKFNTQIKQGNLSQKMAIAQYNAQAEAAKENLLGTGLGQLATAAEGLDSQALQEAYIKAVAPDMAGNFEYLDLLEQIARSRTNKQKGTLG